MSTHVADGLDWSRAPGTLLQGLLACLSLRDLLAARLACRNWRVELREVPSLNLVLPILKPRTKLQHSTAARSTASDATSAPGAAPGDGELFGDGDLAVELCVPVDGQEPPYAALCSTTAAIHLDEVRWGLMGIAAASTGAVTAPGAAPSQRTTPLECPVSRQLAQVVSTCPRLTGIKINARAAVHKQYSQEAEAAVGRAHGLWLRRLVRGWGVLAPCLRRLSLDVKSSLATLDVNLCDALCHLPLLEEVTLSCKRLEVEHAVALSQLSRLRCLSLRDTWGGWVASLLQQDTLPVGPAAASTAARHTSQPSWTPATPRRRPAASLTCLTHLSLDTPGLKDGLPWARTARQLQKLSLTGYLSPNVTPASRQGVRGWSMGDLTHLERLRMLSVQMQHPSESDWQAIRMLTPQLTELRMNGWKTGSASYGASHIPLELGMDGWFHAGPNGAAPAAPLQAAVVPPPGAGALAQPQAAATAAEAAAAASQALAIAVANDAVTRTAGTAGTAAVVPEPWPELQLPAAKLIQATLRSPLQLPLLFGSNETGHTAPRLTTLHISFLDQLLADDSEEERDTDEESDEGAERAGTSGERQGDGLTCSTEQGQCEATVTAGAGRAGVGAVATAAAQAAMAPVPDVLVWEPMLRCATLRELNVRQSYTMPLTDPALQLLAERLPQLEVFQYNGNVARIGATGWAALHSMRHLLVLALGSVTGVRLRLPVRQLPRQLQCLSLLNTNLLTDTDLGPGGPGASVDTGPAYPSPPAGGASASVLPPGLKQLTLRFSHLHMADDAHGLLGLLATTTSLITLEITMFADGLLPPRSAANEPQLPGSDAAQERAGGALSPSACAWRQLSALVNLEKLALTLPTDVVALNPNDYRDMLHEVCTGLPGLRHLSLQAVSGDMEISRADTHLLCSCLTALSVLELGVLRQGAVATASTAPGTTAVGPHGASTSRAAAAQHMADEQEPIDIQELAHTLAARMPTCRFVISVNDYEMVMRDLMSRLVAGGLLADDENEEDDGALPGTASSDGENVLEHEAEGVTAGAGTGAGVAGQGSSGQGGEAWEGGVTGEDGGSDDAALAELMADEGLAEELAALEMEVALASADQLQG